MSAQCAASTDFLCANTSGGPPTKFQCWAYRAVIRRVRFSPLPPMQIGGCGRCTGRGRLSLFLLDPNAEGVQRQLIDVEMTAPEKQWSLFFDDVGLGPEALIGVEGEGGCERSSRG